MTKDTLGIPTILTQAIAILDATREWTDATADTFKTVTIESNTPPGEDAEKVCAAVVKVALGEEEILFPRVQEAVLAIAVETVVLAKWVEEAEDQVAAAV